MRHWPPYSGKRAVIMGLALVMGPALGAGLPHPGAAAATPPVVGVVIFYSPSPLPWAAMDVVPERYGADDLTASLAKVAQGRFAVLPRSTVEQAEQAMRWKTEDVLRYARLRELAGRLHADRLVVSWIRTLEIMLGGSDDALSPPVSRAAVTVQIFDASQGRLVMETQNSVAVADGRASTVLDRAVQPTVGPVSAALAAPAGSAP